MNFILLVLTFLNFYVAFQIFRDRRIFLNTPVVLPPKVKWPLCLFSLFIAGDTLVALIYTLEGRI